VRLTFYSYENRAFNFFVFSAEPNLVETTKACAPVFAPYFMAGVVVSFFYLCLEAVDKL
jgi:hypothetical protein